MIKNLLVLFAVVVFFLLCIKVIDENTAQWAEGAVAAFMAAFLPIPEISRG